jgi:hypothetical protein
MDKPWAIELDDGTGAERGHCDLDGAVKLHVGYVLPQRLHGREWRIEWVSADLKMARAVPHE